MYRGVLLGWRPDGALDLVMYRSELLRYRPDGAFSIVTDCCGLLGWRPDGALSTDVPRSVTRMAPRWGLGPCDVSQ